jgi:hypothetical protein
MVKQRRNHIALRLAAATRRLKGHKDEQVYLLCLAFGSCRAFVGKALVQIPSVCSASENEEVSSSQQYQTSKKNDQNSGGKLQGKGINHTVVQSLQSRSSDTKEAMGEYRSQSKSSADKKGMSTERDSGRVPSFNSTEIFD